MHDTSISLNLQWQDCPEGADAEFQAFLAHLQRCRRLKRRAGEAETSAEPWQGRCTGTGEATPGL